MSTENASATAPVQPIMPFLQHCNELQECEICHGMWTGVYFSGDHKVCVDCVKGCDPRCGCSTGIHDGWTYGSGELDGHGCWENPCPACARSAELRDQKPFGTYWPFE